MPCQKIPGNNPTNMEKAVDFFPLSGTITSLLETAIIFNGNLVK